LGNGLIFNIQHFSVNDGPGIRTTVFMKGCNLRCFWCHNPESVSVKPDLQFFAARCIGCGECVKSCPEAVGGKTALFTQRCTVCGECADVCYTEALEITGKYYEADELADLLLKDKDMLQKYGGVTFSGGEPLLQTDFLLEVMKILKSNGIHIAVESAMNVTPETVKKILPYTDLFLCDIKNTDADSHKSGTGVGNERILDNISKIIAFCAETNSVEMIIRIPVIPSFNADADSIKNIGRFVRCLPSAHKIELLPFHNMCKGKYDSLGLDFLAKDLKEPSPETIDSFGEILSDIGITLVQK
jgi:pyruvate formate lyase activating enzyme